MTAIPVIQSAAGTTPAEIFIGLLIALPLIALFIWLSEEEG